MVLILLMSNLLPRRIWKHSNNKKPNSRALLRPRKSLRLMLVVKLLEPLLLVELDSSSLDPVALVCQNLVVMSKARRNGKLGLKTTLTGSTTKLLRQMLDLHITQPLFNLTLLVLTVLVCPSSPVLLEARKNGKAGLKIMSIGSITKLMLLT